MIWLALDSATDRASVAVGRGAEVLASRSVVGARRHAALLLPALEEVMAAAGIGYAGVEGIVLADGPGSFTGLRVGATVAKALVRIRAMPLRVAPSLLGCAAGASHAEAPVLAVSDALRGEVYAGAWRFTPSGVETLLVPSVLTPDAARARVPAGARVVGPAAALFGGEPTWPDAGALLRLVATPGGTELVADPARWEPAYGRPAEAQAKWERDHGRPLDNPASPVR